MQSRCPANATATLIARSSVGPTPRSGRRTARCVPHRRSNTWQARLTPSFPQVFIKDVKSSNGTFVNGERLSPEATESEPYELKSEDHLVRRSSPLLRLALADCDYDTSAAACRSLASTLSARTTRRLSTTRSRPRPTSFLRSRTSRRARASSRPTNRRWPALRCAVVTRSRPAQTSTT